MRGKRLRLSHTKVEVHSTIFLFGVGVVVAAAAGIAAGPIGPNVVRSWWPKAVAILIGVVVVAASFFVREPASAPAPGAVPERLPRPRLAA
ncbi:MAG: hypothetical protein LC808_43295, partial [Actinobacteria bacterium]|nr:hypothetical protein [Actinomycetota bacterium]